MEGGPGSSCTSASSSVNSVFDLKRHRSSGDDFSVGFPPGAFGAGARGPSFAFALTGISRRRSRCAFDAKGMSMLGPERLRRCECGVGVVLNVCHVAYSMSKLLWRKTPAAAPDTVCAREPAAAPTYLCTYRITMSTPMYIHLHRYTHLYFLCFPTNNVYNAAHATLIINAWGLFLMTDNQQF